MLPKHPLAMLIVAGLSAGCTVGPDYVRPDTPMPERYLGQAAVAQRHARADMLAARGWPPNCKYGRSKALLPRPELADVHSIPAAQAQTGAARAAFKALGGGWQPDTEPM